MGRAKELLVLFDSMPDVKPVAITTMKKTKTIADSFHSSTQHQTTYVKLLTENPAIEIEMSAHTDSRGSDEYNITLSQNRARSVMEYILAKVTDKEERDYLNEGIKCFKANALSDDS